MKLNFYTVFALAGCGISIPIIIAAAYFRIWVVLVEWTLVLLMMTNIIKEENKIK